MAIIESADMISEGKLAAVIIFALIAGIVIGVSIGFLIWRAHVIPLPLALLEQTRNSFLGSAIQ